MVFTIDMTLTREEPMLKVLKNVYNIQQYPTIVVEEVPYTGVIEKEQLGQVICKLYKNPLPECEQHSWLAEGDGKSIIVNNLIN